MEDDSLDLLHGNAKQLALECREWSKLFPHIRVRGHQILPSYENGYEYISNTQARCISPYFMIPGHQDKTELSSRVSRSDPTSFAVQGLGLRTDLAHRPGEPPEPERYVPDSPHQGVFSWAETRTAEALKILMEVKERSLKSKWYMFKYQQTTSEERRCATPTPRDPHSTRDLSKATDKQSLIKVEVVVGGTGGVDACRTHLAQYDELKEQGSFVLLMSDTASLKQSVEGSTLPRQASNHSLVFIHWNAQDFYATSRDEGDEDASASIAITERSATGIFSYSEINAYDILQMLKNVSCPLYELHTTSYTTFLRPTNCPQRLLVIDDGVDGSFRTVGKEVEETFAQDGVHEEWLAHDDAYDSVFTQAELVRPDSARPTSGRVAHRPGSARPTSARNIEVFQQHANVRMQSAAMKSSNYNWKRFQ
ncbi:hypothetical protein HK101_006117 [Irineochytrium annulatum]|nr:hypothetical protein HK101_006117 [Irineochytrium annulatum]